MKCVICGQIIARFETAEIDAKISTSRKVVAYHSDHNPNHKSRIEKTLSD